MRHNIILETGLQVYYRPKSLAFWMPVALLAFNILFILPLSASPFEFNRLENWNALEQYLNRHPPRNHLEHYLLARALLERKEIAGSRLHYYKAAGLTCLPLDESCLRKKAGTVRGLSASLAVLRAAEMKGADQAALLATIDYKMDTAVSRAAALQLLGLPGPDSQKLALALQSKAAPVLIKQGEVLQAMGRAAPALNNLLLAAPTASLSEKRQIKKKLEANFQEMLEEQELSRPIRRNRLILSLHEYLSTPQIVALKKSISVNVIQQTSSDDSLLDDGLFLIRTDQIYALPSLAQKMRQTIHKDSSILLTWLKLLYKNKDYKNVYILLRLFEQSLKENADLWRLKLDLLKTTASRQEYFAEKTKFLNVFGWHFGWSDELVTELIGSGADLAWAEDSVWQAVERNLKPATSNGRIAYWLHRYYKHKGMNKEAERIARNSWKIAPGSYYARSFWDNLPASDYALDWRHVVNREQYLSWIAVHGGNTQALTYIGRRNLSGYRDARARAIYARMLSGRFAVPEELVDLYVLGELPMAEQAYASFYSGRINGTEHYERKAYIGRKTGRLNLSVYYTRMLLRNEMIPEDPFSLPPGLLKILYPEPYHSLVDRYAREYNIMPEMVYALMHQESLFRETAISRSGARGLMQVMPATGKWVAGKLNLNGYNLLDPSASIQIGTKFFSDLIRQYDGDFRWSAIAYNGGPGNLRKWKRAHYQGDFNLFLERLPESEPRNYCRITYQNFMHYRIANILKHSGN